MGAVILLVTDLELQAAQVVKYILLGILVIGCLLNLRKALKVSGFKQKIWRTCLGAIFIILALPVLQWLAIERALLISPKYAIGTTIDLCQSTARGQGIEFKYQVKSGTYTNCNTFHPISLDSIVVPDGRYYVRYSEKYPGRGRIDFYRPVY